MLPDNFTGALIVSVVNISVVFSVLVFISLVITLTYKLVSGVGNHDKGEKVPPVAQKAPVTSDAVTADSLEAPVRAAIMAALAVYLDQPVSGVSVFVRKTPDSGAWGSLSRKGFSGVEKYRSRR